MSSPQPGLPEPLSEARFPLSEAVLYIIPSDPCWQPDQAAISRAVTLVEELCPDPLGPIEVEQSDLPQFINGAGLESLSCPRCGTQLDFQGWWMARMEEVYQGSSVSSLAVTTPCCDTNTALNDLVHDVPSGFSRFGITVWSPNRGMLSDDKLARIGDALGQPVRQIWSRI